jgi:hypothetical protein
VADGAGTVQRPRSWARLTNLAERQLAFIVTNVVTIFSHTVSIKTHLLFFVDSGARADTRAFPLKLLCLSGKRLNLLPAPLSGTFIVAS